MANQTVTTVVNYDSADISGLENGETLTINGGSVTVNSDVRWNQQSAVFGPVPLSSTLGGSFLIDGTEVWEIPFDASTGDVPTQDVLGNNQVVGGTSGAVGELLRVWGTGLLPIAAGQPMPATGWIKLRTKAGTFQDDEVITLPGGATITVNSTTGGKRSWINVAAREATSLTIPRLGNFSVTGDWYELGETNGEDNQQIQFPVADECPAIQIETAPGSGEYEWWLNGGRKFFSDVAFEIFTGGGVAVNVSNTVDNTVNSYGMQHGVRMRETATTGQHNVNLNYTANNAPADTYTFDIELKKETRQYAVVILAVNGGSDRYGVLVDLDNGTIVNPITVGSPTNTSHSITSKGNGWYLVSVTVEHQNSSQLLIAQWGISDSSSPTLLNGLPTFTGDTDDGIFFYEPRLVQAATSHIATDARGKYFGSDYYTGVITLARRGAVNSGLKPQAGCKIRIPNVILSNANPADYSKNYVSTALTTRYDFITTNSGAVSLDKCVCNWYPAATNPVSVTIENSAISAAASYSNVAGETHITDSAIGISKNIIANPLTISNCFSGGIISNNRFARQSSSVSSWTCLSMSVSNGFTITNTSLECLGGTANTTRGVASYCSVITNAKNINITNCNTIGGGISVSASQNVNIQNLKYADLAFGGTSNLLPVTAILITTTSTNCKLNGFSNFADLSNVHPYTSIVQITTNCSDILVENIGTPEVPYNCGTFNQTGLGVALSATSTDVELRRIYLENTRTAPISTVNTIQNLLCTNVWGDGADSQVMLAVNALAKGCRWSNPGTAQSAVYGTHWEDSFISTTDGRLMIIGNEPISSTANQCVAELTTGSGFTSAGGVSIVNLADNVTWTLPYYALGHNSIARNTSGAANAFTMVGTNLENHYFEYQIDKNDDNGFGEWKHLVNCVRRSTGGAAGANTITLTAADLTNLTHQPDVGDYVQTATMKLPAGTTITNIASNVITVSNNVTTSLSTNEVVYFWKEIADEVIDPEDGYRLKVRCKVSVAVNSNVMSFLRIPIDTDATNYKLQYDPPLDSVGTITNYTVGSRIQIFNVTTNTELVNRIPTVPLFNYPYADGTTITEGDLIRVRLTYVDGATAKKPHEQLVVAVDGGWSVLAQQQDDVVYNNIGLDGSTITEFSADYPNIQVDISDPDGQTSLDRLYSWFAANEHTQNGIRDFFNGIVAEDGANFKIVTGNLDLKLDNASANGVLFTGDLRLYRDDNTSPIVTATSGGGSIIMFAGKVFVVETLQTGLTPTESAALTAIKDKTDTLPAIPASEDTVEEAVKAAKLAVALSASK